MSTRIPITVANVEKYLLEENRPVNFSHLEYAFLCTKRNQSERMLSTLDKLIKKDLVVTASSHTTMARMFGEDLVSKLGYPTRELIYCHLAVAKRIFQESEK